MKIHLCEDLRLKSIPIPPEPGCETGAMPPFGNLDNMPVYVDAVLELDKRSCSMRGCTLR